MNNQIAKLYAISKKNNRLILGLMSGTSLDGLDIALCAVSNQGTATQLSLLKFDTLPYSEEFRFFIRKIFAKKGINQQDLCGLNAYVGIAHARLINQALGNWQIDAGDIDLIASHGQTVYHAPQSLTRDYSLPNSTLQIGDGDHIAVGTGIITVSDFRQKHIAAGGEGAPLAAYGDYLLFTDEKEHRVLLNIGGISNFTFLPSKSSSLQAFATDLGPGNTMMNQFMQQYYGLEMDKDAQVAKQGKVHEVLLEALLAEEFLALPFPKTTGPELFNLKYLEEVQKLCKVEDLPKEDVMATLNAFSASAIVRGILKLGADLSNLAVYVSGGGLHNTLLLDNIRKGLPGVPISSMNDLGMNPDAKEACLFALLANETIAGSPQNVVNIKDSPAICMGKISLPY